MTIELRGNWKKGFAYDVYTLRSVYLGQNQYGHDQFDNTYSDIGELVRQLKYRNDKSVVGKIIDLVEKIKEFKNFDAIIPIPATKKQRPYQPVDELALELGKRHDVKVLTGLLTKKAGGPELKNVDDPGERRELLKDVISLSGDDDISGQNVLLLDDVYRSGATLSVATDILLNQAKVKSVCVFTMTKTRSNR